jgi:hypothetical protein
MVTHHTAHQLEIAIKAWGNYCMFKQAAAKNQFFLFAAFFFIA